MTTHLQAFRILLVAATLGFAALTPRAEAAEKRPEIRALERALRLLPKPPSVPVRFIDPELAADPEALRRIDAFLVREANGKVRQVIFLNRRSAIVENAIAGRDIDIAILAAVVRHEQEHLRGGTEKDARLVEREFFQSLVFAGHVPTEEGLAYLRDLEQHHQLREG
jgi:hypothetical protein